MLFENLRHCQTTLVDFVLALETATQNPSMDILLFMRIFDNLCIYIFVKDT